MAISLFVSYAPCDRALFEKLEVHLRPFQKRGQLAYSHAGMTPAGAVSQKWLAEHLEQAQLIVCLISADYLALMDDELTAIFAQQSRGARIIPILVRPAMLAGSALQDLKPLPSNGRPVSQWSSADEAWLDVAQGLWALAAAGQKNAPTKTPGAVDSPGAAEVRPNTPISPRKVRTLLEAVLKLDSDLEAFCIDFFPKVASSFGGGMDRSQKLNLLLQKETLLDIVKALKEAEPALFAQHSKVLLV